jgi:DNA-binding MarR family transcriptional regulator
MSRAEVETVMRCYRQIFSACHRRHVRDGQARKVPSAHQAGVLEHLDEAEGMPLGDLARQVGVTASTMSLTVDRLERGGYVRRERSKEDGRRVDLRLTPAGARIKGKEKALEPELVAAMLARLGTRKRRRVLKWLTVLGKAATVEAGISASAAAR